MNLLIGKFVASIFAVCICGETDSPFGENGAVFLKQQVAYCVDNYKAYADLAMR